MMYSYYGGTLTLDTWDDATYEEELVYYFKDSYRGQYVSLGTAGTYKALQLRYRQRLRWKVVIFKENPRITNLGDGYRVTTVVWRQIQSKLKSHGN